MKAFFEEYGFVLVSIVVVMMLVAMVPTVGDAVSSKLEATANNLTVGFDENHKPSVSIDPPTETE